MKHTVLALDTSTEMCSVALRVGNQWAQRSMLAPREHSQKILTLIDEVLAEFELGLADVEQLVVGHGPGSFTGVRIGVSVAQGLAFSQNLPVVAVSTLAALAQQAIRLHDAKTIVSAIDARMNEVYVAVYHNQAGLAKPTLAPQMASLTALAQQPWWPAGPVTAVGTGWQAYGEVLAAGASVQILDDVTLPLAEDMIRLADAGLPAVDAADLEPLYVRNEVTWKKLPGRA
ncbi:MULTISPECIES: tRNA (adenosine(37)-N6)-threonylcarbamoyltransferase complex dimerization subunit type 1 TsaB [Idiomarina]|uniref:tRNA (adenosine(37)-N6)-threonylcarbamoyltransferase complex dimerization subunit type 1 TsaB n=1 Tax=Idiomarina TaxID=135575 RepID=UPI00138A2D21|nr:MULTISPECIES: tRNA (adenosine(37)-N6)-threonylcarbamoyltransferase complex dimerization subunit type 1 TsaB [Idiomarina]MRJ42328.1 tRNA (adenosine(37)-N6)-threonylcarbamoyltransferase complex dimerization subunit type 1 TsaB [Idiomarina sp. FeN1]NCU57453.1 tRNA (adenosine(37)-N6)-threonylcarbamoyltransferase complex dimerization subunit type 1 TsaB [Idiomarina sp. FenA--70]NCU60639.1 tRNA (adenosine(37)-N6)-threonylcarbamoyltransferase complex dimerization subunit type 1 TsaB [Idiomarina sp. 